MQWIEPAMTEAVRKCAARRGLELDAAPPVAGPAGHQFSARDPVTAARAFVEARLDGERLFVTLRVAGQPPEMFSAELDRGRQCFGEPAPVPRYTRPHPHR